MIEIIIVIVGLGLDILSKNWITANFYQQTQNIIPGVLSYTYAENTGAAFGMLSSNTVVLAITSLLLAGSLAFVLVRYHKYLSNITRAALALIIAGGIGNMLGRIFNGFVVDFIQVDFVNFAIFNIADICITFGTILLIMAMIFIEMKKPDLLKEEKQKKKEEAEK